MSLQSQCRIARHGAGYDVAGNRDITKIAAVAGAAVRSIVSRRRHGHARAAIERANDVPGSHRIDQVIERVNQPLTTVAIGCPRIDVDTRRINSIPGCFNLAAGAENFSRAGNPASEHLGE